MLPPRYPRRLGHLHRRAPHCQRHDVTLRPRYLLGGAQHSRLHRLMPFLVLSGVISGLGLPHGVGPLAAAPVHGGDGQRPAGEPPALRPAFPPPRVAHGYHAVLHARVDLVGLPLPPVDAGRLLLGTLRAVGVPLRGPEHDHRLDLVQRAHLRDDADVERPLGARGLVGQPRVKDRAEDLAAVSRRRHLPPDLEVLRGPRFRAAVYIWLLPHGLHVGLLNVGGQPLLHFGAQGFWPVRSL
mmetsp:Transcript_90053/g.280279  ORF Transcript_90053/g.280279 Transcript_90053/m.280279 type:complete len:240 (-) Transcript_90053:730-1449(-)